MLELLSLFKFDKNKNTFPKLKSFQKGRKEKTKKKKEKIGLF